MNKIIVSIIIISVFILWRKKPIKIDANPNPIVAPVNPMLTAIPPLGLEDTSIGFGSCVNLPNDYPNNASESDLLKAMNIVAGANLKWGRLGVDYDADQDTDDARFVMPQKIKNYLNAIISSQLTGAMITFSADDFEATTTDARRLEYCLQLIDFIKQLKAMAYTKGKLQNFKFIIDVWNEPNSLGNFWRTGDPNMTATIAGTDYAKLIQEIRYRLNLETDEYIKSVHINGAGFAQGLPNCEDWFLAALKTPNARNPSLPGLKALNSIGIHFYSNKNLDEQRGNVPETVFATVNRWRTVLKANGQGSIPMISGEWGHFNVDILGNKSNIFVKADDISQARNNIRGRISLMALGIGFHNVFGWNPLDNGFDADPKKKNFPYNIFEENGNIYTGNLKPAGEAEKTFISVFNGYANKPEILKPLKVDDSGYDKTNVSNQRFTFKFKKPSVTTENNTFPSIYAAWTQSNLTNQSDTLKDLPSSVLKAKVINFINGQISREILKTNHQIIITNLSREPVYLKLIYSN